ncbi:MAG: hypothetical protein WDO68_20310 [Gammaproteobacteria bacterium]
MRRVPSPKQRLWVISTLLVALLVRALIPAGFMPATDRPFSFQVCPDGFPAALLAEAAVPAAFAHASHHPEPDGLPAVAHPQNDGDAFEHAGHHHGTDGPLASAHQHDDGGALAHAGHQHAAALAHAGHHNDADGGGLLAAVHHHNGPGHNHSSANAEHCVFAAAAGAFALAFSPAFSAPAAPSGAPDVAYVSPAFESRRFRIPQPRGPPARS